MRARPEKRKPRGDKRKRRLQLAVLHDLLDLLEYDRDNETSPMSAPAKLYSFMLVGTLLRSLRANGLKLPKSTRRARELGIVNSNEVPKHEKKLRVPRYKLDQLRKRLNKTPARNPHDYWDDEDDDGLLA